MTLFYSRTISILLAAGALGACTTMEGPRPNYPIAPPGPLASPPAAVPPVRSAPPPEARPTAPTYTPPVASSSLPPVGAPRTLPPPPAATPARPPAMVTREVVRTSVTGRVVDADGPARTYTVKKGDNLDAIARTLGTTRQQLAKDNDLKEPYRLQPGDRLKGPQSEGKAYVVGSGDTLFAISRRFGVTPAAIAEANDMAVSDSLRTGRRLLLPEGFKDKGPTRTVTTVTEPAPYAPPPQPAPRPSTPPPAPYTPPPQTPPPSSPPPSRPAATPPASTTPAPRPTPTPPATRPSPPPAPYTPPPSSAPTRPAMVPSSATPADAQISELGRGRFQWPVRGEVISEFGPKGTGSRNDGINIRSASGEPVRAAAAGDIVYAGDQVPGFGNLVLIKHADGWVTAYGHLGRVDVKMTEKVVQGQQIGQSGATGGVSEPQVHFEVRYAPTPADRARPVDPKLVLPR